MELIIININVVFDGKHIPSGEISYRFFMLARNEYLKIHNDNIIFKILIGTVYLSTLTRNKQEDALHLGFGCL